MGRIGYRIGQFVSVLADSLRPLHAADLAEARTHLPVSGWPLFVGMSTADQRHSLRVLRTLLAAGGESPALFQAALLHDCAKGVGGRVWYRVAAVLLKVLAPAIFREWMAMPALPASDWRYPFWVYVNHPARGAELAAAGGCDPLAVELIARHQDRRPAGSGDPLADALLAALQAADDDN
jgi:hypothetical protein